MPDDADASESSVGWREPLLAFAVVVAALIGLSTLATFWGPLSDHILALAAIVFLAVPFVILRKKDEDFHRFGIDLETVPLRHVGLGLAVTAVIFPLYAIGYHFWETGVEQRQFEPSADNYRQWSVQLDAPPVVDPQRETIQFRTVAGELWVEWIEPNPDNAGLVASADRPFVWSHTSGFSVQPRPNETFEAADAPSPNIGELPVELEPAELWYIQPRAPSEARLILARLDQPEGAELPHRLRLRLESTDASRPPDIVVGTQSHPPDEPVELQRTHWWLILWALTHLIVVALPEEYFYRGYLQTRIHDLFGDTDRDEPVRFLGFTRANWLTSGLFAAGHVLIPVGGAYSAGRAAVFFPSLLFGWLRDRTGSIIAPTIFHAGANMMVLVVAVHYF